MIRRSFLFCFMCMPLLAFAQSKREVNYDESNIPAYVLPDVLRCEDGRRVTTAKEWEKRRRPELLKMLSEQEYGVTPRGKVKTSYEVLTERPLALGGKATMREVMMTFGVGVNEVKALMAVYVPNQRKGRVPVFIAYNFQGNRYVTGDTTLLPSPHMLRPLHPHDNLPGWRTAIEPFPVENIIDRGYALVTLLYEDICPDYPEGASRSVASLFPAEESGTAWQAIGAWAWGSSRVADWVCRQPWVNRKQLIVIGHSRQGKAALWAGAQDERFQVVISNNSGCGGAALSKRQFGETVGIINGSFPHWFCRNFRNYNDKEQNLPFDQHELVALVAPRHAYVASASEDRWADQKGEYLAAYYASPVWALYGMNGLSSAEMPPVGQQVMTDIGYHMRPGKHSLAPYDWQRYMDFCDKVFGR